MSFCTEMRLNLNWGTCKTLKSLIPLGKVMSPMVFIGIFLTYGTVTVCFVSKVY